MSFEQCAIRRDRVRVTREELEELFVHLMHCPPILQEARLHLTPEAFHPATEELFSILLGALYSLLGTDYPDGRIRYKALLLDVLRRIDGAGYADEKRAALLYDLAARPDDIDCTDPTQFPGLIYYAYKLVTADQLDEALARRLLQRLLRERLVLDRFEGLLTQIQAAPEQFSTLVGELRGRDETISALGADPAASLSVGARRADHEARVDRYRGKPLVGLRTGLHDLDDRTLGLRGLTILGSRPGVGKTALAVAIALGVCAHHQENDAIVLFLSLEMDADAILSRVMTHLADMDWRDYTSGSPALRGRPAGPYFHPEDQARLEAAEARMVEHQVDRRLFLADRADLGEAWSADRIVRMLERHKAEAGATRALVVIDHLQYVPVSGTDRSGQQDPNSQGELEADKLRVRLAHRIVQATRTGENPAGDAVLALLQARKPPTSKDRWGQSTSELLGSVELAYIADAVILLRAATPDDLRRAYAIPAHVTQDQVERFRQALRDEGISPVVADLAKGRDGMMWGELAMEFLYRRSIFRPVESGRWASAGRDSRAADDDADDDADERPEDDPQRVKERGNRRKVLEAMGRFPAGLVLRTITREAGLGHKTVQPIVEQLVAEGTAVEVRVRTGTGRGRKVEGYDGFKLSDGARSGIPRIDPDDAIDGPSIEAAPDGAP